MEDESQLLGADDCPFVGAELAHLAAVEPVVTGGRPIEAAEDIHQRAFARARRAHERDQLAALDRERDPVQHRDVHFAQVVGLADVVQANEFHRSQSLSFNSLDWDRPLPRKRGGASGLVTSPPLAAGACRFSPTTISSPSWISPPVISVTEVVKSLTPV